MKRTVFITIIIIAILVAVFYLLNAGGESSSVDKNGPASVPIDIKLAHLDSPKPDSVIKSPLIVTGQAAGFWFFEGDFPVKILDANENELGVGIARAIGPSMTIDLVPFEATVEFRQSPTATGFLILEKDNPTGFEENDQEIRYPVRFR